MHTWHPVGGFHKLGVTWKKCRNTGEIGCFSYIGKRNKINESICLGVQKF